MLNLKDKIFSFFSLYDKRVDINKDADDKGTLERFNELIGSDVDDEIEPLVNSIMVNIYEPENCFDRYIPYLESMLGYSLSTDPKILYPLEDIEFRRRVLSHILKFYTIKGTKKGYAVLLGMLGMTVEITEVFPVEHLDSDITLDHETRTFDMNCPSCTKYELDIEGPALTDELHSAILNIIEFNEPINAVLDSITYNGDSISGTGDFNSDFNSDFF